MKTGIAIFLLLGVFTNLCALGGETWFNRAQADYPDGILESIENANITQTGERLLVSRKEANTPVELVFLRCQGLGVEYQDNQWWILPVSKSGMQVEANTALWVLPLDAAAKDHSWHLVLQHGGNLRAQKTEAGLTVTLD